jgi:hypothetical protein
VLTTLSDKKISAVYAVSHNMANRLKKQLAAGELDLGEDTASEARQDITQGVNGYAAV